MSTFLEITQDRILSQGEFFFIVRDKYPVSPGHMLIISNEAKRDYFDLSTDERKDLDTMILLAREIVEREFDPDGYNIGFNCGAAAGQTVFHFHCHLIPRYHGDTANPRGGIRHCIPAKGYY